MLDRNGGKVNFRTMLMALLVVGLGLPFKEEIASIQLQLPQVTLTQIHVLTFCFEVFVLQMEMEKTIVIY